MRYVYLILMIMVTIIVLLFAFQNTPTTTVSFFSARVTLPLWMIILATYVIGVLTGGSSLGFYACAASVGFRVRHSRPDVCNTHGRDE